MSLNANVYLTMAEVADWLNVSRAKVGQAGGTLASKVIQDLTYQSKLYGTDGNNISVEYAGGAAHGSETVQVNGKSIKVTIADGVTTAAEIKTKVDSFAPSSSLVTVTPSVTPSNPQSVAALQYLSGGVYAVDTDPKLTSILEMLMNSATAKVESIIRTPVLAKDFTEYHDGNNSNTIVPHHWPVVQINSLKIDTLRQFPSATAVDAINYFLRAQSDKRQASTDVSIRLLGTDVVIRDDNEKYIIGRLFMGSALGSIELKYKAGWALSAADVPADVRLATLQLIEFYFVQRDNKDINVSSKSVKGESYSKLKDSIPEQIIDLLAPYEDISLGDHPQPQRNTFKI